MSGTDILAQHSQAAVVSWGDKPPLVTPAYFPALSSVATGARVLELLEMITEIGYPRVLVSAYDLAKAHTADKGRLKTAIRTQRANGNLVFMDSGVFESYWKEDATWSFDEFSTTVRTVASDVYTTYDGAFHRSELAGSKGYSPGHVTSSKATQAGTLCLAIVHGSSPDLLVKAVQELAANGLVPNGVAVPERECGPNVFDRIRTIHALRQAMNGSGRPLLHVLGCGHPQAIAAYVLAGADSFDSLDWMQVGLDPLTRSYTDLAMVGALNCQCVVCKKIAIDNPQRSLLHNLRFYQDFGHDLQRMIREGTLRDQVLEILGKEALRAAGAD